MDPSRVVREAREVLARAVQCYEAATSSAEAETAPLSELKAVHSRSISKGGKHD